LPHDGGTAVSSISGISSIASSSLRKKGPAKQQQLKLYGNTIRIESAQQCHIAIADFICSNALPFSITECPKFRKVIEVARFLGPNYRPPDRRLVGGKLMDLLFKMSYADLMSSVLSESEIFGISVFGDGATIKSIPLINILAASPNNPMALLDIVDCSAYLAEGGKKDAPYLANMIFPHIAALETSLGENNRSRKGVVDLILMDGAANVQKSARITAIKYPRVTVIHGAEHVVSLFFKDVYTHVSTLMFQQQCIIILYSHTHSHLFVQVSIVQNIIQRWQKIEECIWFMPASSTCHVS